MSRFRIALAWFLRIGLAGLLLYAGLAKLHEPLVFAREIANYQLLPQLAPHVAATLPVLELVAALAMLLPGPRWRPAGALLAFGLMATFLVAVTSVVLRGVDIDCGCFGSGSGAVTWLTVVRNLGLSLAALYLVFEDRGVSGSASGASSRGPGSERGDSGATRPG